VCRQVVVVLPVLPDPGPLTWPGRAVTRLYPPLSFFLYCFAFYLIFDLFIYFLVFRRHADTIWNSKTSLLSMLQQNGGALVVGKCVSCVRCCVQ
jgi:hypothetical protein